MTDFNTLMTEHLDLPWRVQYSPACYMVLTANGSTVVDLDYDDTDPLEAEGARVSAYLIAAAPKMYRALSLLERRVSDPDFDSECLRENAKRGASDSSLLKARAALAKAEGRQ